MQDLIAALISFLIINPLSAEFREQLNTARAPQAIVSSVASCIDGAGPALVQRVWSDPWWVATTSFSVWVGRASLEDVAMQATPACAPAIRAAVPFLRGDQA